MGATMRTEFTFTEFQEMRSLASKGVRGWAIAKLFDTTPETIGRITSAAVASRHPIINVRSACLERWEAVERRWRAMDERTYQTHPHLFTDAEVERLGLRERTAA